MIPEFSRIVRLSEIGTAPRPERIGAKAPERAALVERFGLAALDTLDADLTVRRDAGGVRVKGRVQAKAAQICAISGEPVPVSIDEPIDLLFASETPRTKAEEEIELGENDLDIVPLEGEAVDLGEAVAQSFGLALDPYPRASEKVLAAARAKLLSEEEAEALAASAKGASNPFRVLKGGLGD